MLVYIVYVVQAWIERYEYWSDVVEPSPTMFGLPTVGYDTEDVGQAKLSALREAYPDGKYQLVRRTTTTEEIA